MTLSYRHYRLTLSLLYYAARTALILLVATIPDFFGFESEDWRMITIVLGADSDLIGG